MRRLALIVTFPLRYYAYLTTPAPGRTPAALTFPEADRRQSIAA